MHRYATAAFAATLALTVLAGAAGRAEAAPAPLCSGPRVVGTTPWSWAQRAASVRFETSSLR